MGTWGWVVLTLGSACLGVRFGSAPAWADWALLAVGLVLVVAGVWAVLRGRQHLTPVLTSLQGLPADERMVVFLRAFTDDAGFSRVAALRWFRLLFTAMLPTPAHLRTEEDQVVRAFAPFGRTVALGRTSDRLPRLGAERHYASDPTWKAEVLAALDRASLVLLATGAGRNLGWEVEEVVRRDDPTRVVLLVSHNRGQYEEFRESLGDAFPNGLPDYPPTRLRHGLLRGRYVRAAIWFDSAWTPHWEMLDGRFPLAGLSRRTQRVLPRALRAVYRRAGVPDRVTSTMPRPWAVKLSVPLTAAFWLGPVVWTLVAAFASPGGGPTTAPGLPASDGGSLPTDGGPPASGGGPPPSDLGPPTSDVMASGGSTGSGNVLLDLLTNGWVLWVWVAVVAACVYRVWCGGPYAITMARIQGVVFPVFLVAAVVSTLLSPEGQLLTFLGGMLLTFLPLSVTWLLYFGLALLVLGTLGMPVGTGLLIRYDVRVWIDARL